jgi:thiol:disulfide interchange protein DsbC
MLKHFYLYISLLATMSLAQADVVLKDKLEALLPGMIVQSLEPLENTGLYEALVDGEIIYFSKDGRYVFQGDIIEIESRQNITENKRIGLKKEVLASFNEADMIIFEPEKTNHTLTVFTDIDCGYCRKLHQQMSKYNALGIKVRYMAFPRSGIDSESFDKAVNVWCADDRKQAMTDSKSGANIEVNKCDNPIKDHFEAGRQLGVTGTPALFLESGQLLPGYIPPMRLKKILDEQV